MFPLVGVVLRQDGDATSISVQTAKCVFYASPRHVLETLATSRGVSSKGLSLYSLVRELVQDIMEGIQEPELQGILGQRGCGARSMA